MTSTPCQSAALERIAAPWTAKIAGFLHTIVKTILTIAEIVRTILRLLALRPGLSWPMMPKLETMSRHARLLRRRTGFLPPSARALHAAIGAAPAARITDNRKIDLDVCLSTQMRAARQAPSPQVVLDRSREAHGSQSLRATVYTGSERRICPHVNFSAA